MGSVILTLSGTAMWTPATPPLLFLLSLASWECVLAEGEPCSWNVYTAQWGDCASNEECRGEQCIVDGEAALPGCCAQSGGCISEAGRCQRIVSPPSLIVERRWGEWGDWGACTSGCGEGTMTRVRNALGEEGLEVEQGSCRGDCKDVEQTNEVLPPNKPFLPFFSSQLLGKLVPSSPRPSERPNTGR